MKFARIAVLAAGLTLLSGRVTQVGPVEVTRFHTGEAGLLGKDGISVEPASGSDASSLEWQTYRGAVRRQRHQHRRRLVMSDDADRLA